MENKKTVLSLMAHPDDAEFSAGGLLTLLRQKGWEIHIATTAKGDCGSTEYGREEISRIRFGEGTRAAAVLGGKYYCLQGDDLFIMYERPMLMAAIQLLRQVRPTIVLAPSPNDYMFDHEMSSHIAQTACFGAGVPNISTPGAEPYEPIPYLFYADPPEGKDRFGTKIIPHFYVDIASTMASKEKMLACHESQRNWLMAHHKMDEYIQGMKHRDSIRGGECGCTYAEAFRQHLGHGYPQDNILQRELPEFIHERRK